MKMLMRIVLYCVGLLFMAFGVAFSVNSNLGVSPVNSLPYVISLIVHQDLGPVHYRRICNLHGGADHHQAERV